MPVYKMINEVVNGTIEYLVYLFKMALVPIVRVGNIFSLMLRVEITHHDDFVPIHMAGQAGNVLEVTPIHGNHIVERHDIFGGQLTNAVIDDDVTTSHGVNGPRIGIFADMITAGSAGSRFDNAGKPAIADPMPEDGLSHRRAANVAQANKEYFYHILCSKDPA